MHKHFIVTSNYSINELWPDKFDRDGNITFDNNQLRTAIERRCFIYPVNNRQDCQDYIEDGIEMLNFPDENWDKSYNYFICKRIHKIHICKRFTFLWENIKNEIY